MGVPNTQGSQYRRQIVRPSLQGHLQTGPPIYRNSHVGRAHVGISEIWSRCCPVPCSSHIWVSKNYGPLFGSPCNKDQNTLGFIFGPQIFSISHTGMLANIPPRPEEQGKGQPTSRACDGSTVTAWPRCELEPLSQRVRLYQGWTLRF